MREIIDRTMENVYMSRDLIHEYIGMGFIIISTQKGNNVMQSRRAQTGRIHNYLPTHAAFPDYFKLVFC